MRTVIAALLFLLTTGCGGREPAPSKPALTQREKDSILAASKVPGAPAVRSAIRAADSASGREHITDTLSP